MKGADIEAGRISLAEIKSAVFSGTLAGRADALHKKHLVTSVKDENNPLDFYQNKAYRAAFDQTSLDIKTP